VGVRIKGFSCPKWNNSIMFSERRSVKEEIAGSRKSSMGKALIIIDMVNDFIDEKGALFCGKESARIVPYIKMLREKYRKEGGVIIYACDAHRSDDEEFKRFKPHCIEGTWGAEIVEELAPEASDHIVLKTRYSAFYGTALEDILETHDVDEIGVVGVCTSICIMDTVGDLANRDYKVKVFSQGIADFDNNAAKFAIKRMESLYGAEIVD
jgi:nicotinamidase/pyrazinamidase